MTPELQNLAMPVFNEQSSRDYIDQNEIQEKYFKAKWDHYVDKKLSMIRLTTKELEESEAHAQDYDEWVKPRVEYMYDNFDFANQRRILRDRFMKEMHKKTTLEDVGGLLDRFILDSKANTFDNWHPHKHLLE